MDREITVKRFTGKDTTRIRVKFYGEREYSLSPEQAYKLHKDLLVALWGLYIPAEAKNDT